MEENEFDLRGLLGVLRRQARLIVITVLAVLALAAVAIFSLKPVYTASALILVDTSQKNILDPSSEFTGSSSDSARVESEVELAKSETVMLRVVQDANLLQEPEFMPRPGLMSSLFGLLGLRDNAEPTGAELLESTRSALRDAVTVQRRGLTYLISIQARSAKPQTAARIANAVARTYITEQVEAKINSTLASKDIIQGRIADASAAVAASEDAVDVFIGSNFDAIASETGRTDLMDLRQKIDSEASRRTQLASQIEILGDGLKQRDWTALVGTLQSDAVRQLEARRLELDQQLAAVESGTQKEIDLRAELAAVEGDLAAQTEDEIGGLQQQIATSQSKVGDLKAQLRSGVLSSNLSSSTLTRIYGLQQTAEIARNQYQILLTRMKDLDQQAYLQVADSRIASEALPPNEPSFPNPKLLFALAGLGALALGIGLAFVYENYIGGVVSGEQLQVLIRARRALTVPRQREHKDMPSLADSIFEAPLSMFSESVRKIRVAADQAIRRISSEAQGKKGAVVLVTSAAPNEGKTTIALSLARAYSLSGKTALLIDCDLRKPSVHKQLGKEPSSGLIDYLSDTQNPMMLQSIVSVDQHSGAGVLVGSRRSDVATDQLVAGSTFSRLIDAATKAFDIVILDTPPIGPVVDGLYLAPFADAVVFVVRWASTTQPEVRASAGSLADAMRPGVELIPVLNQSAVPVGAYGGKYAGYYSDA